jgi:hypothetical protein
MRKIDSFNEFVCFLTRNTQIITMNKLIKIFIPYIPKNVYEKFIEKVFIEQNLGQVMDIQLHNKQIRVENKLQYSNHSYAFISLYLFNTVSGNKLLNNIKRDNTTYIFFQYSNGTSGNFEIKPYLTVSDRLERGYQMHIKDDTFDQDSYWSQWLEITSKNTEQKNKDIPVSISFYNNIQEKMEYEKDYRDIESGLRPYYIISSSI